MSRRSGRAARTKVSMSTAIDAWLKVYEVEATILRGYEVNARRYIKPALAEVPVGKIGVEGPFAHLCVDLVGTSASKAARTIPRRKAWPRICRPAGRPCRRS